MKASILCLAVSLMVAVFFAVGQSTSPPSRVSKEQATRMASVLTNGMPERVADKLLADQGLKCSWVVSDAGLQSRTYHYNFTNGTLRVLVRPKTWTPTNEWYSYLRTNGFVSAADINGAPLKLKNAP